MKRIDKKLIDVLKKKAIDVDYDLIAKNYQSDKSINSMSIADILSEIMDKPYEVKQQEDGVIIYLWRPDSFTFLLKMLDEISKRLGKPSNVDMKAYMNDNIPTKYYTYDWHKTIPVMSLTCLCSEVIKTRKDRIDVILIVANNLKQE
jgi:hypothetical protein